DPLWTRQLFGCALMPDLVLYLEIDVDALMPRVVQGKGMDYWESGMHLALGNDIFESFQRYQRRLIEEYNVLARVCDFASVATRRLRTALRLFGPLLPARFAAAAHRDLAWLGGAIGAVRDLDVLSELLRGQAARLDPELRRAGGPLGVMLQEQRARALAALGTALDAKRCRRLLERLAAFADSRAPVGRGTRLGDVAPDLLRPHVRAVVRAGRRLGPDAA